MAGDGSFMFPIIVGLIISGRTIHTRRTELSSLDEDCLELNIPPFHLAKVYRCCAGALSRRQHTKHICMHSILYRRVLGRTIRCDKSLDYTREKYDCCGGWRYKPSHRICYRGKLYKKTIKISCKPGFQPMITTTPEGCVKCPLGFFSDKYGLQKCHECQKCDQYVQDCNSTSNSICSPSSHQRSVIEGQMNISLGRVRHLKDKARRGKRGKAKIKRRGKAKIRRTGKAKIKKKGKAKIRRARKRNRKGENKEGPTHGLVAHYPHTSNDQTTASIVIKETTLSTHAPMTERRQTTPSLPRVIPATEHGEQPSGDSHVSIYLLSFIGALVLLLVVLVSVALLVMCKRLKSIKKYKYTPQPSVLAIPDVTCDTDYSYYEDILLPSPRTDGDLLARQNTTSEFTEDCDRFSTFNVEPVSSIPKCQHSTPTCAVEPNSQQHSPVYNDTSIFPTAYCVHGSILSRRASLAELEPNTCNILSLHRRTDSLYYIPPRLPRTFPPNGDLFTAQNTATQLREYCHRYLSPSTVVNRQNSSQTCLVELNSHQFSSVYSDELVYLSTDGTDSSIGSRSASFAELKQSSYTRVSFHHRTDSLYNIPPPPPRTFPLNCDLLAGQNTSTEFGKDCYIYLDNLHASVNMNSEECSPFHTDDSVCISTDDTYGSIGSRTASLAELEQSPDDNVTFPLLSHPITMKELEKTTIYTDSNEVNLLSKDRSTQTSLKQVKRRNILGGDWDRGGMFDCQGGCLETDESDVKLIIPENAVGQGLTATVAGKVFTNLTDFVEIFDLTKKERFVSPVVEFVDSRSMHFETYLTVKIPIALSIIQDAGTIRVLCVPGNSDLNVREVPLYTTEQQSSQDMVYILKDDGFVYVYTKHFTVFVCTTCSERQLRLNGLVFGCCQPTERLTCEAEVRLYLCDNLHSIKDFRKALEAEERGWGRQPLNGKTIRLNEPANEGDQLLCSMELPLESNWNHDKRRNGSLVFPDQEVQLSEVVQCHIQAEFPPVAAEWKLSCVENMSSFECLIDLIHRQAANAVDNGSSPDRQLRTTISVKMKCAENIVQSTNPEDKLFEYRYLAKNLMNNEARLLGRELGMSDPDLDAIYSDNQLAGKHEIHYQVIRHCVSKLGTGEFEKNICHCLEQINRKDLSDELKPKYVSFEDVIGNMQAEPERKLLSD